MTLPFASYQTSRDYRKLWELAHTAQIICIVDRDKSGLADRRIVTTRYYPDTGGAEGERIYVEAFSLTLYCNTNHVDQFVRQCERCSLEWLVPAAPAPEAGEVAEVVADLQCAAARYFNRGFSTDARRCRRAATLLQQQEAELGTLRSNEADRNLEEGL